MSNENNKKALKFLKNTFDKSEYLNENLLEKDYRYQHTLRVADIAIMISKEENLDKDILVIAALFHDISYACKFNEKEDWLNHGRKSSAMVQNFLDTLDLNLHQKKSILEGIAMHVDDDAKEYTYNGSKEALSIGECDNIDRFASFRNIETLNNSNFFKENTNEKIKYLKKRIEHLNKLKLIELSTKTGKEMWIKNLDYQINFTNDILSQLKIGDEFEKLHIL